MDERKLPEGWEVKKLGEIADIKGGKRIPKGQKLISTPTKYPYIRVSDFNSYGSVDLSKIQYITKEIYDQIKRYTISDTDLYISIAGTIGKSGIIPHVLNGANLTENACKLVFNDNVYNKFILYFTQSTSFLEQAGLKTRTTAMPKLALSRLSTIILSVPPLPEQKRIVSILDKTFAEIEKAKSNARQNLKNAKELFESYLQGVFENRGEGWEEKRFDEICVLQRGFDLPTRLRKEGSFPLVSSNGITDKIDVWKIRAPGVVTGRSGTIGKVHFIEEDYWPLNTALFIKEFHSNYERCIYYFLKQYDLAKYGSGAGVPTLNRNNVHSEMVWFPKKIEEQKQIVGKLDQLSTETKKMENIYQKKISDLEELKKSVLQKAFRGEL